MTSATFEVVPLVSVATYKTLIVWASRFGVGALLLAGGVGKLYYATDFRKVIDAYQLVPRTWTSAVSLLLVALELTSGVLVFVPALAGPGGLLASGLFCLFAFAISVNLLRGKTELPCGCFGKQTKVISWLSVLRDVGFAGLAVIASGRFFVGLIGPLVLYVFLNLAARTASKSKSTQALARAAN